MDKNLEISDKFKYNSEQAAEFERQGQYEAAYNWWNEALKYASQAGYANMQWVYNRASFCRRWALYYV